MKPFGRSSRSADFGRLGEWLEGRVSDSVCKQCAVPFTDGLAGESAFISSLAESDTLGAVALSLLYARYPVQVRVNEWDCVNMAEMALSPFCSAGSCCCVERCEFVYTGRRAPTCCLADVGAARAEFKRLKETGRDSLQLKSNTGASNKVNIYFSELWASLDDFEKAWVEEIYPYLRLLSNDQASAAVLHGVLLATRIGKQGFELGIRAALDPDGAKKLNMALKAVGGNYTQLGAMLCEMDCLQGRGVGTLDLKQEGLYRTQKAEVEKKVTRLPAAALRGCIRTVLEYELGEQVVDFESTEDYWSKRWLWCVNGSHSRVLEKEEPKYALGDDLPAQVHRRVFAERCKVNPIEEWSGRSYFTGSHKLENGKMRAIFGGDSASYCAFQHLLDPVERAWRNRRCILDPGSGGTVGMVNRVRKLRAEGGASVMLDYDDFNSNHTTEAMQMVFEELVAVTGYDTVLGNRIINSFADSWIYVGGAKLGRSEGTLMSGHRATTFINSVLNQAYVLVATAGMSINSFHVGDDVYISAKDTSEGARVLEACASAGLRMNVNKQSFGRVGSEFLRVAMGPDAARGYLARSVSSCVSGNWVNEVKLDAMEGLQTIVSHAWTLTNRSRCVRAGKYLYQSACRMTRLTGPEVTKLLMGQTALGEDGVVRGQAYGADGFAIVAKPVREETPGEKRLRLYGKYIHSIEKAMATREYLSAHVTPVEQLGLEVSASSVLDEMVDSSYSKTLSSFDDIDAQLRVRKVKLEFARKTRTERELIGKPPTRGVLNEYPLLGLLKSRLSRENLLMLLRYLGEQASLDNCEEIAWGSTKSCAKIDGFLPYADALMVATRDGGGVCQVVYPVMV